MMILHFIFLLLCTLWAFDLNTVSGITNNCDNGGWVKIYQQSGTSLWHSVDICGIYGCLYRPISTDYLNFDKVYSYEGNGYAFLMVWDKDYWIQWKQEYSPHILSSQSTPNPLSGEYEDTLYASENLLENGTPDFYGLSRSSDNGVILDGRNANGAWFAVGVTPAIELTDGDTSNGLPAWVAVGNNGTVTHYANLVQLYVWDPICGNWGGFPTESPTTPLPTATPSPMPTHAPTTPFPTSSPTFPPSVSPTDIPTLPPTESPTLPPTESPTLPPTSDPTTQIPSRRPTEVPTNDPSKAPTRTPIPTRQPTDEPEESTTSEGSQKSNFLWLLVGFLALGFIALACFVLLCNLKLRKSKRDSVNKALNELSRLSTKKGPNLNGLNEFQTRMNEDIFMTRGRNEPEVPYNYKRPSLGQQSTNVHYMQRNSAPTMTTLNHLNLTPRQSSPPILVQNQVHSFGPITAGQVVVQRMPIDQTRQIYPHHMTVLPGQLGVTPQHVVGLQPQLNELSYTQGHSYMQMPEESMSNDMFHEPTGITTQGKIYAQRQDGSVKKSISRGHDGLSLPQSRYQDRRGSPVVTSQKQFRYLENSRAGLEHSSYLANPVLLMEKRSSRKEKKKKRRKSKKLKSKNSRSVVRLSHSEDENVREISPRSFYMRQSTLAGTEVSDDDTSSTNEERISSPRTVSVQTRSIKKAKKPLEKDQWSKDDSLRMVTNKFKQESLHLLVSADENSIGSSSESVSNCSDNKQHREDFNAKAQKRKLVSNKVMQSLALEPLPEQSSIDDWNASFESSGDVPSHKAHFRDNSIIMPKMKEADMDLDNAGVKIPKSMEELKQQWQKSMLDTVAEKYFDKNFLEGGALADDASIMDTPTGVNSPIAVGSPKSGHDSSSESPDIDLGSIKLPTPVLSG